MPVMVTNDALASATPLNIWCSRLGRGLYMNADAVGHEIPPQSSADGSVCV